MNSTQFDQQLANRLNDPQGQTYSSDLRKSAQAAACRAYSYYFPAMRRFGTGSFLLEAPAGQNKAALVGPIISDGDVLVLEPYTSNSETVTVQSVSSQQLGIPSTVGYGSQIVFTANLTKAHPPGAPFQEEVLGLALTAGQDTYPLPRDFISMDKETWDLAIGIRSSIRQSDTFYDAIYSESGKLSQVGWGMNQQFGPIFFPWASGVFGVGTTDYTAPPYGGQLLFRFIKSDFPQLVILPAPVANATLNPIFYYGQQTAAQIPDSEMEDCMLYALWAAMTGQVSFWAGRPSYSQADLSKQPDKQVAAVTEAAAAVLDRWDIKTRYRPILVSG